VQEGSKEVAKGRGKGAKGRGAAADAVKTGSGKVVGGDERAGDDSRGGSDLEGGFDEHVRVRLLEVNLVEESCVVMNRGRRPLDIGGWVLRDEHEKHELLLPKGTVVPGNDGRVTVWLCSGRRLGGQKKCPYNEYKGVAGHVCLLNKEGKPRKGYVLNNSGDFLRLYDVEGDLCAIGNVVAGDDPLSPLGRPRRRDGEESAEENDEEIEVEEDMINSLLTLIPEGEGATGKAGGGRDANVENTVEEADEEAVNNTTGDDDEGDGIAGKAVLKGKPKQRGKKLMLQLPQLDAEGNGAPSLSPSPTTTPTPSYRGSPLPVESVGEGTRRESPIRKSNLGISRLASVKRQREPETLRMGEESEITLRLAHKEESALEGLVLLPPAVAETGPAPLPRHSSKRARTYAFSPLPPAPKWFEDVLVKVWFEARVANQLGRLAADEVATRARRWMSIVMHNSRQLTI